MVEITSTTPPPSTTRGGTSLSSTTISLRYSLLRKPVWLYAIYLLFGLVCLNAIYMYQQQKEFVRMSLEDASHQDDLINEDGSYKSSYSAGAEEHVVSGNYGSSMYGGGIHTARNKPKTEPTRGARMTKLENIIEPKPSNGHGDFNARKPKVMEKRRFYGFRFYALTDTPFNDWQSKRLRTQMADLRDYVQDFPEHNVSFGIHLGNTQKVSNTLCLEESYESTSTIIAKRGPRPTLIVPGNNDWFDCPFRQKSWEYFLKYFGHEYMVTEWHAEHYDPLNIQRSEDNPELFVFYYEGILFIGVHLLHTRTEEESRTLWDERMKTNMEWVAHNVEKYFHMYPMRGVILFGHAPRTARTRPFFDNLSNYFLNITTRQDIPVMYLHGHGREWQVDYKFSNEIGWDSFVDVQIHPTGLADPVMIEVASQVNGQIQLLMEENGNQTVLGNGLFRIDRRQGVYEDPLDIPKSRRKNKKNKK